MLRPLLIALALSTAANAQAAANCPAHPKSSWMSMDSLRERLKAEGYQIKILKVDGQCYEMYGRDAAGKKVEIYFDTVTGLPFKTRIQK